MKYFFYLLFLIPIISSAQVLQNKEGNAFTDKPFFNREFIQKNKIKQLKGVYTYKKHGDIMRETKYIYVYRFDRNGNLISTIETCPDDGSKDTVRNIYRYDENNLLTAHLKSNQDGFQSIYFEYDSLGRVISEEFKRESVDSNHRIIESITFNKETFVYQDFGLQTKRTRYNSYNLPYLDEFFNKNELGYLVERIERLKMTNDVYTISYEYNEKGLLSAIRKRNNKQGGYTEEYTFEYDELGNLEQKHIYRNGVFTTDIQIIYNSKSKLISSIITRQVSTGFLMILRFREFEYYD